MSRPDIPLRPGDAGPPLYTPSAQCIGEHTFELAITTDKENWIFGAANTTQWLFALGLDESLFRGLLDNSEIKKNKRLYGTNLFVKKPEEVISPYKENLRIFLNLAQYNKEIFSQVKNLNEKIECIFL